MKKQNSHQSTLLKKELNHKTTSIIKGGKEKKEPTEVPTNG